MISIPSEIVDHILGDTDLDDKPSFASCSLVCSSWRPFAQTRLFKSIQHDIAEQRLDQFLAFLLSAPHIAGAVNALRLWYAAYLEYGEDEIQAVDDPNRNLSPDLLMNVVAALPALSELRINRVALLGWPRDAPPPTAPTKLANLFLSSITYKPLSSPDTLPFDILSLFDVDELYLADNRGDFVEGDLQRSDALVLPYFTPAVVRKVKVYCSDCFLRCNLDYGGLDTKQLRAALLCPTNIDELAFAGLLLQQWGSGLVELEFSVCSVVLNVGPSVEPGLWSLCSLAPCRRLESLQLDWTSSGMLGYGWQPDIGYSHAYGAVLADAPRTLRRLVFTLPGIVKVDDGFGGTMRAMAPLVQQAIARFPQLETVTIGVRSGLEITQCVDVMRELLPDAVMEGGVFRFVQQWPW
ncbi:hypothetical protein C8Q79DRAFT_900342 [Trametes meyenii]|nr:hypothetical protein C8Q79DRAFT_900342 [Trametes meyenii]